MGIIARKSISIPPWVRIAIALTLAAALTLIASLLTMDNSGQVAGKAAFTGAILVVPLVFAARSEWSAGTSFALAFAIYFCVCLATVWFFTRENHDKPR